MAVDEWESPGINPRSRSPRINPRSRKPYTKSEVSSARSRQGHVANRGERTEHGHDNAAFEGDDSTSHYATSRSESFYTTTAAAVVEPIESQQSYKPHSPLSAASGVDATTTDQTNSEWHVQRGRLHKQPSDSGVDVESIHFDVASDCNSPAVNRNVVTDRRGFTNSSIKSDPGNVGSAADTRYMVQTWSDISTLPTSTSKHMQSIRVEAPYNTWHSMDTLVKIHIDVLELINESAMLGPYCLQSELKRCKLRSSDRPPSLTFSIKQNRFINRRTSFDDLEGHYLDFTNEMVSDQTIKSLQQAQPLRQMKEKNTDIKGVNRSNSAPVNRSNSVSVINGSPLFGNDDISSYGKLVMQRHLQDEGSSIPSGVKLGTGVINHTNDLTSL